MTNSSHIRAALAKLALKTVPPIIVNELLGRSEFRKEYGFKIASVLSFGKSELQIRKSEFFDAIRSMLANSKEVNVNDIEGKIWTLRLEPEENGPASFTITSELKRYILPDFSVLSQNESIRLDSLDAAAYEVNLPILSTDAWRERLLNQSLEDNDVDEFHEDLSNTPVRFERSILDIVMPGQSDVSSLVPCSRRYFDRIVGVLDQSCDVKDYAKVEGRKLFDQLSEWRPYEGFLYSLFLSSHSDLTRMISIDNLGRDELFRAYHYIEQHGDILSQLGAIEVGLRNLQCRRELEPYILRLVRRIRDDDIDSPSSEFGLFGALFVLVDGELSTTQIFYKEPPFYRRMASLAHAALIHRQFVGSGISYDSFREWALACRGEQFFMQSYTDMRLEPRWNPHLIDASQIKSDFFGRIMIAANNFKKNIPDGELHKIVLGNETESLHALSEFPAPYLPGPLEATESSLNILPAELAQAIETQLGEDEIQSSSFVALVNSALIFQINASQATLAAQALRLGNHRLANVEQKSQLLAILHGLASVAAVSRSITLAEEVRILVRRYRHDTQFGFPLAEALCIALVAAASHKDVLDWRDFVGNWLIEFSYEELHADEGQILYSHLQSLLHCVPELWVSCARADAALEVFCS